MPDGACARGMASSSLGRIGGRPKKPTWLMSAIARAVAMPQPASRTGTVPYQYSTGTVLVGASTKECVVSFRNNPRCYDTLTAHTPVTIAIHYFF